MLDIGVAPLFDEQSLSVERGKPAVDDVRRQDVQQFLDRRRPGGNKHGTPRNEKDKVVFLAGLYQDDHDKLLGGSKLSVKVDAASFETEGYEEGYTTGEPIAAGASEEVEIRATALHAVEGCAAAARRAGRAVSVHQLDAVLWNRGQRAEFKARPRHRTRTAYY